MDKALGCIVYPPKLMFDLIGFNYLFSTKKETKSNFTCIQNVQGKLKKKKKNPPGA